MNVVTAPIDALKYVGIENWIKIITAVSWTGIVVTFPWFLSNYAHASDKDEYIKDDVNIGGGHQLLLSGFIFLTLFTITFMGHGIKSLLELVRNSASEWDDVVLTIAVVCLCSSFALGAAAIAESQKSDKDKIDNNDINGLMMASAVLFAIAYLLAPIGLGGGYLTYLAGTKTIRGVKGTYKYVITDPLENLRLGKQARAAGWTPVSSRTSSVDLGFGSKRRRK